MPDAKGPEAEILARIKKISQEVRNLQRDFHEEVRKSRQKRSVSSDKPRPPRKKR